jgi:hypothetical protein
MNYWLEQCEKETEMTEINFVSWDTWIPGKIKWSEIVFDFDFGAGACKENKENYVRYRTLCS